MEQIDITIIGAGAIGLAAAARLASPERTLVVLEENPRHGQETSSRNSEVIHAGIYYAPGTLKARLCVRGKELLYDYGKRHDIKCKRIGKLIVGFSPEDEKRLEGLMKRGQENGVSDLQLLSAAETARREPSIKPLPALFSPSTGIFSADYFMDALLAQAQDAGAMLLTQSRCERLEPKPGGYVVSAANQEPFLSRIVINSSGLNADKTAALLGLDIVALKYEQQLAKGEYFRFKTPLKLNHLIYPPPGDLGLGTHLTPDVNGGTRVGPSAFLCDKKDYSIDEAHKPEFTEGARCFVPTVSDTDLVPDTAGIRPKLKHLKGDAADFIIRHEADRSLSGFVNLIGMESPGLTSSLAIAEHLQGLLKDLL